MISYDNLQNTRDLYDVVKKIKHPTLGSGFRGVGCFSCS
jgi:hypothetical protein